MSPPDAPPAARTKLAVFDIDGTLLRTSGVDDECYAQALRDVFGIDDISTDWGAYDHSTDGAILAQLVRERLGRPADAADVEAMRSRFVTLLRATADRSPDRFAATTGAAELLPQLERHGWAMAIATGGWRASAELKLARAGLGDFDLPAAFADDHASREGIIATALTRARDRAGVAFERAVYVGDGPWDVRAAKNAGLGFVGVAHGERAQTLRCAGAALIHDDFRNAEHFIRSLDQTAALVVP